MNFSPVQFDDHSITVGRLPYGEDGETVLRRLRDEHHDTHVFRRQGAGPDSIVAVSAAAGAPLIGEPETIRLKDDLRLGAALIRNALLNSLAELGGISLDYEPIKVVSRRDLLRISCAQGFVSPPGWLGVRLVYELAIRPIFFFKGQPFVAALPSVYTTRMIERTAADLLQDGLCLDGTYVGRRVSGSDARVAPKFEVVGCVRSVDGSRLRLTDSRDSIEVVEAAEVWPAKDVFAGCLSFVFKERASEISEVLECQRATLRQGPTQLERIRAVVGALQARRYEMVPGVPFTFGSLLDHSAREFPRLVPTRKPVYVFNETGSQTHESRNEGLDLHKPYTAGVRKLAQPRICVICQKSQKVQVEQFLRKFFFTGVTIPQPHSPESRRRKNYFETGLCRKYAIENIHHEYFFTEGPSAASYHDACQEALEQHGNGHQWDLALVQIEEAFQRLPRASNPYLVAKMSFQSLQIIVQEFKIETTQQWGAPLSYCLNQMGLATYAKLGGIPWLLKTQPVGAHELVIGLGSTEVGEGRLGKRERFVGFTTIFGADGTYHLYNASKAVSADKYQEAMLKTLRGAIDSVRTGMNWQPGDRVRLVFHAKFKQFGKEEVQAVTDLVGDFREYDMTYALLHISDSHPYMMFDTDQDGVRDFESGSMKGRYAPKRGRYLQIGNRDVLLSLAGPYEVKRPEDGTPRPLLLSLHTQSSFTDMGYLTNQVYAFACNSWRTFLPISLPVTIQYPSLISNLLGELSCVYGWNPDVMLGQIGKEPWFL